MEGNPQESPEDRDGLSLSRKSLLLGAGGAVLAGGLAACGSSSSDSSSATSGSTAPAGTPKAGGNFRLGVTGGGSKDMIDGQSIITKPDQARLMSGWETLLTYNEGYELTTDGLAKEVTQDNPTQWTVTLKDGIEFNNGKTLDADDVIYSIQRILDPKAGLFGAAGLASVDPNGMKKMDSTTVRLKLKTPDSGIADQLGQYYNGIVPKGYSSASDNALKWVGTGPFITQSFNPGQQSVHTKNKNYWRTGQPYFDQVTIIDFSDPSAQVNALLSGQIDAMTDIPFAQIEVAKSHGDLGILISEGGGWLPLCMAVDMAPFDNPKVRQAMRLIVDRPAMLEQVLSGYGRVANDIYSPFDSCYDSSLPQREQDIEQAKSLLAERRHVRPQGRPAHDGRRGRHGRLRQRVCRPGEGRRRDHHGQERPELLRRPVPQAAVLGRLLGHAQLPAPGRQRVDPRRAVQRDPLAAEVGPRLELRRPVQPGAVRGRETGQVRHHQEM